MRTSELEEISLIIMHVLNIRGFFTGGGGGDWSRRPIAFLGLIRPQGAMKMRALKGHRKMNPQTQC